MNGDHIERLSQESECRNEAESSILESASAFAQRVVEEIEALAGTTTCRSTLVAYCSRSSFGFFCRFFLEVSFLFPIFAPNQPQEPQRRRRLGLLVECFKNLKHDMNQLQYNQLFLS